jgi:hypothetical protein
MSILTLGHAQAPLDTKQELSKPFKPESSLAQENTDEAEPIEISDHQPLRNFVDFKISGQQVGAYLLSCQFVALVFGWELQSIQPESKTLQI